MTIKEFRELTGMTQREIVEALSEVSPALDIPTFSKLENGAGDLSEEAWGVLLSRPEIRVLQHGSQPRKASEGIRYRPAGFEPSKASFSARVLEECSKASEDRPVTKEYLAALGDCSEREVRRTVEELRRSGVRIVSTSHTRGYWLAGSASEYARLRADYMSRAMNILRTVKAMDSALPGQMSIEIPEGRDE